MNIPSELKYTQDHEWARVEDNVVTVGISDYAQEELGDIVNVELPDEEDDVHKSEAFGAIGQGILGSVRAGVGQGD